MTTTAGPIYTYVNGAISIQPYAAGSKLLRGWLTDNPEVWSVCETTEGVLAHLLILHPAHFTVAAHSPQCDLCAPEDHTS